MPYVPFEDRERLDAGGTAVSPGELNYQITKLLDHYLTTHHLSYNSLNACIGVLVCAQHELYRRVAAPYEDRKMLLNGDVYRGRQG